MDNFEYQPLEAEPISAYEAEKIANKSNIIQGTMIFTKSSLGFGFFMFQYYFIKVGLWPGIIFTILTTSLINGFLALLASIADRVTNDKGIEFETLNELTESVLGKIASVIIKIFILLLSQVVILSNSFLVTDFLQTEFSYYLNIDFLKQAWVTKLLFIIVFIAIIMTIVEMEKIKFSSAIALVVYIACFLILCGLIIKKGIQDGFNSKYDVPNSDYYISLISLIVFAMESISSLFSIRATLKKRSDMPMILFYSNIILVVIFITCGLVFLSVGL